MAQQTAVEWLAQQILDNWNDISANARNIEEFIKQALQMEKEQHCKTWQDGFSFTSPYKNFDQYYNETFKPE